MNGSDPSGLRGIRFGRFHLFDDGRPYLEFTDDSLGDLGKGAAATVDGIIPFGDPLKGVYADSCGKVAPEYEVSQFLGGSSRDILLLAAGMPGTLKPFTQAGATEETSLASIAFRKLFRGVKLPPGVKLPAPTYLDLTIKSSKVGTVLGRAAPLYAWMQLNWDIGWFSEPYLLGGLDGKH
ncbi:MAG TPA: hypothetical protein VGM51_15445 [Armatimonadota bacterium]